jgi:hypothetical protein
MPETLSAIATCSFPTGDNPYARVKAAIGFEEYNKEKSDGRQGRRSFLVYTEVLV